MRQLDDPSGMTDDELLRAVRNARALKREAEERVAEELLRRDWSYRRIGDALGLDHRTVHAWVRRARGDTTDHPIEEDADL